MQKIEKHPRPNEVFKKVSNPLYVIQRGDTVLSLLPNPLRHGAVAVKLQRKQGKLTRQLQCKLSIRTIKEWELNAPAGTVIAEASDVITPEVCEDVGYRDDGKGYIRTLTVTTMADEQVQLQIVCTLCVRDEENHLCSVDDYSHVESIVLPLQTVQDMQGVVLRAYAAMQSETHQTKRQHSKPRRERRLDVAYGG